MGALLQRLAERKILVSDGAWGTMLQQEGLQVGECPEAWNLTHPDKVRGVAAAYARAGADLVLTNTFGGSPIKLRKFGLGEKTTEINSAGVRLSREGAPDRLVVASVGPCGELLEPLGEVTETEVEEGFVEQIGALREGGAQAILIETMTSLEEALCALRAARRAAPGLDVAVTMTFDPVPDGYRTMMGVDIERAVRALEEAGADVLGTNCGNGIDRMIPVVREFRRWTDRPLLVHANAGQPEIVDGQVVFREDPEYMAGRVQELVELGAAIVGGCCGTTPRHIAAFRREADRLRGR